MLMDDEEGDHPEIVTVPSQQSTPTPPTSNTSADSLLGPNRPGGGRTTAAAAVVVEDDDDPNKSSSEVPPVTPQQQQQSSTDHVSVDDLDISLCTPGGNKLTTSAMVREIEEYLEITHQPIPQHVTGTSSSSPARTKTLRERVQHIEEVSGEESEGANWKEKVRNLHYKLFN